MSARFTENDLRTVRTALLDIRSKWKDIGLELGVSYETLKCIEMKYSRNPSECLCDMLDEWFRRVDTNPCWKTLAEALRSSVIREDTIAQELERKYIRDEGSSVHGGSLTSVLCVLKTKLTTQTLAMLSQQSNEYKAEVKRREELEDLQREAETKSLEAEEKLAESEHKCLQLAKDYDLLKEEFDRYIIEKKEENTSKQFLTHHINRLKKENEALKATIKAKEVECASMRRENVALKKKALANAPAFQVEANLPTSSQQQPADVRNCRTPGCQFFGRHQTSFYCSKCFESNKEKEVAHPDRRSLPQQQSAAPIINYAHNLPYHEMEVAPLSLQTSNWCCKCKFFLGNPEQNGMCSVCSLKSLTSDPQQQGGGDIGVSSVPIRSTETHHPYDMCESNGCKNTRTENGFCDICNMSRTPPNPSANFQGSSQGQRPIPKPRINEAPRQVQFQENESSIFGGPAHNHGRRTTGASGSCHLCMGTTFDSGSPLVCPQHAASLQAAHLGGSMGNETTVHAPQRSSPQHFEEGPHMHVPRVPVEPPSSDDTTVVKELCAVAGCSFRGYRELNRLCPDCYESETGNKISDKFRLV